MKSLFAVVAIATLAGGAHAVSVFNFESEAATTGGALTSLSMTNAGLTTTITRSSGVGFDIFDNTPFSFPLSWGRRSLSPFFAAATDDWFVADFSIALNAVELEMTDFGADDDTAVMEVWSGLGGTGTLLATVSEPWSTNTAPSYVGVGWQSSSSTALSIRFRGESAAFPNSLFVDNIMARPVPEPASMIALAVGAGALLRRRRK